MVWMLRVSDSIVLKCGRIKLDGFGTQILAGVDHLAWARWVRINLSHLHPHPSAHTTKPNFPVGNYGRCDLEMCQKLTLTCSSLICCDHHHRHHFQITIQVVLWRTSTNSVNVFFMCRSCVFILRSCSHVWTLAEAGWHSAIYWRRFQRRCYILLLQPRINTVWPTQVQTRAVGCPQSPCYTI